MGITASVYVYVLCVWCLRKLEEGVGYSESRVIENL